MGGRGGGGCREGGVLNGVVGPDIALLISLGFRPPFIQLSIHSPVQRILYFLSTSRVPCTVLSAWDAAVNAFRDLYSVEGDR